MTQPPAPNEDVYLALGRTVQRAQQDTRRGADCAQQIIWLLAQQVADYRRRARTGPAEGRGPAVVQASAHQAASERALMAAIGTVVPDPRTAVAWMERLVADRTTTGEGAGPT